jgi:hypothetical protein
MADEVEQRKRCYHQINAMIDDDGDDDDDMEAQEAELLQLMAQAILAQTTMKKTRCHLRPTRKIRNLGEDQRKARPLTKKATLRVLTRFL